MRCGAKRGRGRASAAHFSCLVLAVIGFGNAASRAFVPSSKGTHGPLPRGAGGDRWVSAPAAAPAGPPTSVGSHGYGPANQMLGIGSALLVLAAAARQLTRRQAATRKSSVRLCAAGSTVDLPRSQRPHVPKQDMCLPTTRLPATTLASDSGVAAAQAPAPTPGRVVSPPASLAVATTTAAAAPDVAGLETPNSKQRARFVGSSRCPGARRSHSRLAGARKAVFASKASRRRVGRRFSTHPRQCTTAQVQNYDSSKVRAKIQRGLQAQSSARTAHGRDPLTLAASTSKASAMGLVALVVELVTLCRGQ